MGAEASRAGDYREPDLPKGELEVRLSVYSFDLTGVSLLNSLGSNVAGAYHSGLVVLGKEWSFGGHDAEGESGVYSCKPEMNPDYQFYDRVVMGRIRGSVDQVHAIIRKISSSEDWTGPNYNLFEKNCNHFVSDLCWALLRRRPPDWINRTAESLARRHREENIMQQAARLALASYRSRFKGSLQPGDVPGARAFQDTFQSTFEMAMAHHKDRFKLPEQYADIEAIALGESPQPDEVVDLLRLPDALDIVALRRTVERHAFEEIAAAAKGAAHVVAAAARQAAFARAEQGDAVDAWDAAWARASAPLLKQWREEAIAGKLKVDYSEAAAATSPAGIAQRQRDMQIKAALAAAQSAADEQRGGSPT